MPPGSPAAVVRRRRCCCLANSTMRMAFLLARPTSTTKPICVKMVTSIRATTTPTTEQSRHIGTTRMTANGSFQLSYCAARTRNTNTTARANDIHGRAAGLELHVGQLRPVVGHRVRQLFLGDLPHQGDGLPRAGAGPRVAGDGGGGIQVVAHDAHRAARVAHRQDRAQQDHLPLVVAHLELANSLDLVAEARIGLEIDLPGPAELVEVVDVVRSEVDLQRIEDLVQRHAQGQALGTVDVEVQPGRVRARAVEQTLQTRRGVAARRRCGR